jgi:hypothetical protein
VIFNIIDRRKRRYRWKQITAIVEPTYHDNLCKDSDETEVPEPGFTDYDERAVISVADAIAWAMSLAFPVTLYLYDLGQGINVAGELDDLKEKK